MANHVLSLEVPDTLNSCILRIADTSIYDKMIPISCLLLEVTLPGFTRPVQFTEANILPGFSVNLTACDLEVQVAGCGTTYSDLPDGIYIIKYSVSPNDIIYVEYNHLRITKALKRIQAILCDLELSTCEPSEKVKSKMIQLQEARIFLDAAKAKVEFCHEPQEGMGLYSYALKLLTRIDCKSCNKW